MRKETKIFFTFNLQNPSKKTSISRGEMTTWKTWLHECAQPLMI